MSAITSEYARLIFAIFSGLSSTGVGDYCTVGLRSLKGRCQDNQFCVSSPQNPHNFPNNNNDNQQADRGIAGWATSGFALHLVYLSCALDTAVSSLYHTPAADDGFSTAVTIHFTLPVFRVQTTFLPASFYPRNWFIGTGRDVEQGSCNGCTSVCQSVPSFARHTALVWVCCWSPCGHEISLSIDCRAAGAGAPQQMRAVPRW